MSLFNSFNLFSASFDFLSPSFFDRSVSLPAERVVGAKQNQYTARIRGEAKLVRSAAGSVLFHLVNDPAELSPIANQGDANRLFGEPLESDYQAQLDAFGEVPEPREFTRSEYERLQLEALGYKD